MAISNQYAATPHFGTSRSLGGAILLGCLLVLFYNLWFHRFFYHDDALISLRYALNFVEHGDLSWNLGDRVEGYTNFLHIMGVSGLISIGMEPIAASRVVNAFGAALLGAGIVLGLQRAIPADLKSPVAQATGLTGAIASPAVAIWILGGLETVLAAGFLSCAAAMLLSALGTSRPDRLGPILGGGVFFALAYLTRPDSVVMCFAAGLGVLLFGRATFARRIVQFVLTGAVPLVVIGLHLVWRLSYYGDPLPNTFYAKVGIDLMSRLDGTIAYIGKAGLFVIPVVPLAGAAAIAAMAWSGRRPDIWRPVAFLLLCLGAHTAYVLWSGGDHMPAARVMVGLLGPAAILLGLGLAALPSGPRVIAAAVSLLILTVNVVTQRPLGMNAAAYVGTVVGLYIEESWPKGSTIALATAGSTPYVARNFRYIDMLGLNDREIGQRENVPMRLPRQNMPGHAKGDGASILARSPDYVILGPASGTTLEEPWFLSDIELAEAATFRECYVLREVELSPRADWPAGPPAFEGPLTFQFYERTCP
jgi:hypothetical protein